MVVVFSWKDDLNMRKHVKIFQFVKCKALITRERKTRATCLMSEAPHGLGTEQSTPSGLASESVFLLLPKLNARSFARSSCQS